MDIDMDVRIERDLTAPELRLSDEEIVLLDITGGIYYTLIGAVSIRIWESTSTPRTLENLVDVLLAEFEIDRTACVKQTREFLADLSSRGLVRFVRDA